MSLPLSPETIAQLLAASHPDPHTVLGPQMFGAEHWVVAIDPGAETLSAVTSDSLHPLQRIEGALFAGRVPAGPYRLHGTRNGGAWTFEDPYRFAPITSDFDAYLLGEGTHLRLWEVLGAHPHQIDGIAGVRFAVMAPHARRVSVVGDFNAWDPRRHMMRRIGSSGAWEVFVPHAQIGQRYKYDILGPQGQQPLKTDPVGFGAEHPPANASVIRGESRHHWQDGAWMESRAPKQSRDAPIAIYEVHLPSWRRMADGRSLSYAELAEQLVSYAKDMGFSHIEFMPISEYPFDGSWGYQPVGLYAPTIRMGDNDAFRALVDACHNAGLGVLIDWVPAHFPSDPHGLAQFDGTAFYEYPDPREGFHHDWNTLIYNFAHPHVANFLTANALYWFENYHIDGLRVDAVASMLYRDYSRPHDQWIPNIHGGRENLEAIALLRRVNSETYGRHAGIMNVAEESTAFPQVSAPVEQGGLGFGYKWNMGWMNDTLRYLAEEPVHRKYHHHLVTQGLGYAFSENFVLPISHDEVVHGKGAMIAKIPGAWEEKFATLRAYYGFMWGHPGKKLLFMGQEFAQSAEWNHNSQLDWAALDNPAHRGVQALVRDLNRLYRDTPALHAKDCTPDGFQWLESQDADQSVFAWARYGRSGDAPVVIAANFTPVSRNAYRIGVPAAGFWREVLNTDASAYGGGNAGNMGGVMAEGVPHNGQPYSIVAVLPPLASVFFRQDVNDGTGGPSSW